MTSTQTLDKLERLRKSWSDSTDSIPIHYHREAYIDNLLECDQQLIDATRNLHTIHQAWQKLSGFLLCESCGPEKRYRITIDYHSLDQLHAAYDAMVEIAKALEFIKPPQPLENRT